ncbi:heterokaryon incompatibility protein-domain-containing protein [Aspergillus ambiguus]|uniref:HET domain-containing protein n=1 Tax=Aspergillus ambiguus TaxID=176160 RepID=UPI003CCD78CA
MLVLSSHGGCTVQKMRRMITHLQYRVLSRCHFLTSRALEAVLSWLGPTNQNQHLCEFCQALLALPNTPDQQSGEVDFGQAKEFSSRLYCPGCRLILTTLERSWMNTAGDSIVLRWSEERGFHFVHFPDDGDRIVFVDEHPDNPHTTGRVVPAQLDPALVRSWVSSCAQHHGADCCPEPNVLATPTAPGGLTFLRLIDVQQQCLVEAEPGCRYLALSYVWGNGRTVMLRKKNKSALYQPGGLEKIRHRLAKTISHAMTLVRLIGERYLWVDSLCLVQDDWDDKKDGIQKMDLIYQGSILTIVAASGRNSQAGLPGLHPASRRLEQAVAEVKPGVLLASVPAMFTELQLQMYMTRGWTLQEFVLSPRCLIFLPHQVYFLCRQCVWSEDTIFERFPAERNKSIGPSQRVDRPKPSDGDPYGTYMNLLLRYGARNLTNEDDTVHAMAGILHNVCRALGSEHLWGLPTVCFDLSMLHWDHDSRPDARRKPTFPSWSWCGWKNTHTGFVPWWTFGQTGADWLQNETYIVWYKRNADGVLENVTEAENDDSLPPDGLGYHRRKPPALFFPERGSDPATAYVTKPIQEVTPQQLKLEYSILQFWAHTISVSLRDAASRPRLVAVVYDNHNHNHGDDSHCGALLLEDPLIAKNPSLRSHEAVVLSTAKSGLPIGFNMPAPTDCPCYWIMLIHWNGVCAERTGLGYTLQECVQLASSKVTWKEIVLA